MALEVVILLILGLSSGVRATAITGAVLARQQDDAATQVECPSFTSANSPLSLESIVRAIVDGDWQRHRLVLQLVKEARTLELKRSIYETLWLEWKQTKKNNDPIKLLDLYEHLKLQPDIPVDFQQMVYQTFISRSAHLLSAPLHAKSRCTDFPLVTTLLQLLTQSPQNLTSAIFEAVFDKVLTFETPLSVAQRLGNFNASFTQLATLNLQLMNRTEVQLNSSAHAALLENLRQLVNQRTFREEVEHSLYLQVYQQLTSSILSTAQKVCLYLVNNTRDSLCECEDGFKMCIRNIDHPTAVFKVQRTHSEANNRTHFSFLSPYRNRNLVIEGNGYEKVIQNVYSRENVYWWHVVQVKDGIAIYDAPTSSRVICGGDRRQWEGNQHYAYTRRAEQFDDHRDECTWNIADCSAF